MPGIVESLIMDGLPVRDMRPSCNAPIPPDRQLFSNRPHKVHGKNRSSLVGTNCRRNRNSITAKADCVSAGLAYEVEASRLENAAIERARFDFFGRRALVCRCNGDLVGFAVVHRAKPKDYVTWHAYSPITGEFSQFGEVVPCRSHGLNDGDVRHLSGYFLEDEVCIRRL